MASAMDIDTDYDLVVIGGGSGGMAAAKEAATHGARVALFDYVKPSTQGTRWGLGGTCVNVGCVPKKLMHYAGLLGAGFHDAKHFGWELPEEVHLNWDKLVESVQNHVRSLNFNYKVGLTSKKVNYINALAKFTSPNHVEYTLKGQKKQLSSKYFLIAVGGRPAVPAEIPGAVEHAITSDDIFSLGRTPGKTLCVGASYISLECAGFLNELHFPVTVAVRSILLRGFDQQCAEKIGELMTSQGVRFIRGTTPERIDRTTEGRLNVTFKGGQTEEFDTVLYAAGRGADTEGLGLENTGVALDKNGKILHQREQTNVSHIYGVGDCLHGVPELTPVAIKAGEMLARRLFARATAHMDYELVPTTVFTPFEYGCVGLSEEVAEERYGKENIETYLFEFSSLEVGAAHREKVVAARVNEADVEFPTNAMSKLVCLKTEEERVLGFHYVGPNAGEVTQGFALAVRLGAKKRDFDGVVGIHPTDAESFTALSITRASGESWVAAGGCGGGKCG